MAMKRASLVGLRAVAGALFLAAACATAPKPPEAQTRAKDSAPEKVAAQRAAAPHGVTLEQDDERWGFEAARERRREQDAARARQQPTTADKNVGVTTPPAR
jgi:hypothetical protein